jgi:hypothetical protein
MPAFELYRTLKRNPDIQMLELNPLGGQNVLRFNHLEPPFDNVKVRRAAMAALNQEMFLQAQVGIPGSLAPCFSVYPCKTPYATTAAWTPSRIRTRVAPGAARRVGLLRHADRPPAPDGLPSIAKLPPWRRSSSGRRVHGGPAADELEVRGGSPRPQDRLEHLHHQYAGCLHGQPDRQLPARRRLR